MFNKDFLVIGLIALAIMMFGYGITDKQIKHQKKLQQIEQKRQEAIAEKRALAREIKKAYAVLHKIDNRTLRELEQLPKPVLQRELNQLKIQIREMKEAEYNKYPSLNKIPDEVTQRDIERMRNDIRKAPKAEPAPPMPFVTYSSSKKTIENPTIDPSFERLKYRKYVRDCIAGELTPDIINAPYKVNIIFMIDKNGDILGYNVYSVYKSLNNNNSSYSNKYVDALETAFKKAAPFQPFPTTLKEETLMMEISIENNTIKEYGLTVSPDITNKVFYKKYNTYQKRRNPRPINY